MAERVSRSQYIPSDTAPPLHSKIVARNLRRLGSVAIVRVLLLEEITLNLALAQELEVLLCN